jgi:hypothetical protein
MTMQNPPGFLQNAGNTHTAAQLRMYLASLQAGMSSGATSLRARGGVHPGLGQELVVTQAGSPAMSVLVEAGAASIPGTLSSTQGNYFAVNDAQVTLSVTAAHATLPRIDIVVINVRDTQYSGASNDCVLQVVAGTPASSPVVPTSPDNAITIAQIAVGAAVSSIVNANITDTRFYVAAVGGVINARTEATRPASTEIVEGQHVWTMDGNKLWIWDGSAYNQQFPQGFTKINEFILGSPAASITFSSIPSTYRSLMLSVVGRSDVAVASIAVSMRMNGDTGANYDNQEVRGNAATASAAEFINSTGVIIGHFAGASATAGAPGGCTINIPIYGGTAFWKHATSNNFLSNGTGTGTNFSIIHSGRWRNTAAITSLTIIPASGNLIAGTSAILYGLI